MTASLTLSHGDCDDEKILSRKVETVATFLEKAKTELLASNAHVDVVQTLRLSCNPIEEYIDFASLSQDEVFAQLTRLGTICAKHDVQFVNLGLLKDSCYFNLIPSILKLSSNLNISASLAQENEAASVLPDYDRAFKLAGVTKEVAKIGSNGEGSFRFCVSSNVPSGTPFFPASYFSASDVICFSVGLETSNLLNEAWDAATASMGENENALAYKLCREELMNRMVSMLKPLGSACQEIACSTQATFLGVDASMNPSLSDPGIGQAFHTMLSHVNNNPKASMFGTTGTLSLCYLLTQAIRDAGKAANVNLCGYSGLMLPQMEDKGLAEAASAGRFTVQDLLLFSAVCGVGVDTVPVPGDVGQDKVALLLMDLWALSSKWSKPLSCRVLPVQGKQAGEMTTFSNPYLCNSVVMGLP